jgi:hypothetical protein
MSSRWVANSPSIPSRPFGMVTQRGSARRLGRNHVLIFIRAAKSRPAPTVDNRPVPLKEGSG